MASVVVVGAVDCEKADCEKTAGVKARNIPAVINVLIVMAFAVCKETTFRLRMLMFQSLLNGRPQWAASCIGSKNIYCPARNPEI